MAGTLSVLQTEDEGRMKLEARRGRTDVRDAPEVICIPADDLLPVVSTRLEAVIQPYDRPRLSEGMDTPHQPLGDMNVSAVV